MASRPISYPASSLKPKTHPTKKRPSSEPICVEQASRLKVQVVDVDQEKPPHSITVQATELKAAGSLGEPLQSSATSLTDISKAHSIDLEANTVTDGTWNPNLSGWRFWSVNLALGVGIFLSQMETTIVSTSLVSITNDLRGFQEVSWIVTSYLVTYTGFLAILSKMSDIFGRKSLTMVSFTLFILSSIACGFAQTMNQLIILRACQGIGGGGIYAMAYVIFPDVAGPEMYSMYAAYLSLVGAIAALLGPLLGGAINDNSTWRWVFWINAPIGLFAVILIAVSLPRTFPNPPKNSSLAASLQGLKKKLARIDVGGTFLLLAASVLLVTALEEGGTAFPWKSALPIGCLLISICLWVGFVFYERFLHSKGQTTTAEAAFSWKLMTDRFTMGCLWNAFYVGGMFLTLAITLPQRFQVVHGDSAFTAGVRILPLTLSLPLGTICSGIMQSRFSVPPLYTFIAGGLLHTIGVSLLSTVSMMNITASVYGYQIITGFGLGVSLATCIMTIPLVVTKEHRAVAMGSIGQFRMLGGAVILSIFANVLNGPISDQLSSVLAPEEMTALLQSAANIASLPLAIQAQVLETYESGYQKQLHVLIAFSVGAIIASLLLSEKKPRRQRKEGELS